MDIADVFKGQPPPPNAASLRVINDLAPSVTISESVPPVGGGAWGKLALFRDLREQFRKKSDDGYCIWSQGVVRATIAKTHTGTRYRWENPLLLLL